MAETQHTGATTQAGACRPGITSVARARECILRTLRPLAGVESVPLAECGGRVLAEDVAAGLDMPPFASSAMDGYALRRADLDEAGAARLRIGGRALAGHPHAAALGPGECVRITTGAALPEGADTVVPDETVSLHGERVEIRRAGTRGAFVRPAGSDIAAGEPLLRQGARLRAVDAGLLASQGLARIAVRPRPRVAYFTTGDELRAPGEPLGPGQIHERHASTLGPMIRRLGGKFENLGIVRDEPASIRAALREAAATADMVVTSGGIAAGDADFAGAALAGLGEAREWRVALQPGRALLTGRIGRAAVFGLPGNPVSAVVVFLAFVRPALLRLAGADTVEPFTVSARSLEALDKRPGHVRYVSGILARDGDGGWAVRSAGPQGAAAFASLAGANCFIVLPETVDEIRAGDRVEVMPFMDGP